MKSLYKLQIINNDGTIVSGEFIGTKAEIEKIVQDTQKHFLNVEVRYIEQQKVQ